jgi:hypothetical protein
MTDDLIVDLQELLDCGEHMPGDEVRLRCYDALVTLIKSEHGDPGGSETYRKVRFGITKALAMMEGVIPTE